MATVLIVEDAPLQQALIQRFVSSAHTVVGTVETVDKAIDRADDHEPDVVIVDISLDDGDGIAAAKRIADSNPDAEFIVSTAHVGAVTQERAQAIEPAAYLTKPYAKADILRAIEQAIE